MRLSQIALSDTAALSPCGLPQLRSCAPLLCVCSGHGSFSNNKKLNDLIGNITHASILVPYHGWRISHRTHHANHGHVENDESWYPTTNKLYDTMVRRHHCLRGVAAPRTGLS